MKSKYDIITHVPKSSFIRYFSSTDAILASSFSLLLFERFVESFFEELNRGIAMDDDDER